MWEMNLEQYLMKNKDEKIAVFGTGDISRKIVQMCGHARQICMVDDECAGTYINEILVCETRSLPLYGFDCVIVAEMAEESIRIYRRIQEICKIKVINIFGKPMQELYANVLKMEVRYGKNTLINLKNDIDKNDIVIFDLDNTVFMQKHIWSSDFYKDIEKRLQIKYPGFELFALKIAEYRKENKYISLKNLVRQVIIDEKMGEVEWDVVWDILYKEIRKNFVPRRTVIEAIQYAIKKGKIVSLMEDMPDYRIDREFLERLLQENQIDHIHSMVCTTEIGRDKNTGIFEEIRLRYGDAPCLYVGDEIANDLYLPQIYDMKIFWVRSPLQLFECVESIKQPDLKCYTLRRYFENLLEKFFCNEFALCKFAISKKDRRNEILKLNTIIQSQKKCPDILKENSLMEKLVLFADLEGETERLVFQEYHNPKVSVVIPVFNQFAYTYNCLKAVLMHTQDITYEVIVADDHSTDMINELEQIVSGISVIHNEKNMGFLLNCNHAAEYAKGEYILFLNNDTQVQPGWMNSLVTIMEQKQDAGMVGAKLLYPDGLLQEAGGILWKDGSAWNYGNGKDPNDPEYSYVKETDYISGAAIMIRRSLWKEIGGFDKRFAPAYYEDTDLAFEVRKHGYKVYFQPASLVVHFEGVSNGTNVSEGLKKYQIRNKEKFYQKWKDVLGHEHFEDGESLYLAKDRGQTKKQILVIDHYVPNFDKDAGGRCTYMYLNVFLNMGMKVTFIGDNYAKPQPYTERLQQMGVEVLYGDYYRLNWKSWLKENIKYFDYVYLQRPHISVKYMKEVKRHGRAKVFYFAHDLHHVRFRRDYEVTGNKAALYEAEKWRKIENELFDKADVGHVVGSYEQELVQKMFPEKPVRNIPLYIYDQIPEQIEQDFSKRKDILFVGGFVHQPNIDAVLWFAKEVFPTILNQHKELVWHIVGSMAPKEVQELAGKNIIIEGFLSDIKLEQLYHRCRLVVVPLRYGAGVKGKILEAAYYQVPVVTTHVGGEGIDETEGAFLMKDDAEQMAEQIVCLYTDYKKLKQMSDAGRRLIKKHYTLEAAEDVLKQDMNIRFGI